MVELNEKKTVKKQDSLNTQQFYIWVSQSKLVQVVMTLWSNMGMNILIKIIVILHKKEFVRPLVAKFVIPSVTNLVRSSVH